MADDPKAPPPKPAPAAPESAPAVKPPGAAAPAAAGQAAHAASAAPPSGPPDPPPPPTVTAPAFIEVLRATVPGSVSALSYWVGDWTVIVPVSHLLNVAGCLRDAPEALFDYCSDVTA